MFHINNDVKRPWKLAAKWFNQVANFLNNVCGDGIIEIARPETPMPDRPISFSLNLTKLKNNFTPMLDYSILPLTVKAQTTQSGTEVTVDSLVIYIPSTSIYYEGKSYTMKSGTATATLPTGWYTIANIKTGALWLNQATNKDSTEWTLGSAKASGTGMWGVMIANISSTGVVSQYAAPMRGLTVLKEEGGSSGGDIPSDNITGTVMNTRIVVGSGTYTVTSGCFAPDSGCQLVIGPESMSGDANCLPVITRNSSQNAPAIIANSGIAVSNGTNKKVISGANVKIDAGNSTISEFDNVACASDGTLMLDQTDYAWFNTDTTSGGAAISDGKPIVADGTEGRVKTAKYVKAEDIAVYTTAEGEIDTSLADLMDDESQKIADSALAFLDEIEGAYEVPFDKIGAISDGGNCLVGTDADGYMDVVAEIPQTPAVDKVLMVKAGQTEPSFETADGAASEFPFALAPLYNASGTFYGTAVCLPASGSVVRINNTAYTISGLTAVSGQAGWYRIGSRTTGDFWLNATSTANTLSFGTAELSDKDKISVYIGSVASDGTVTQNTQGGLYLSQLAPTGKNNDDFFYNGNGLNNGTTGASTVNHNSQLTNSGAFKLDTRVWTRGTTNKVNLTSGTRVASPVWTEETDSSGNKIKAGVSLRVCTRTCIKGDDLLWFFRTLVFDSDGRLQSVSAEKECYCAAAVTP